MARSKRARLVTLSKTDKKGRQNKNRIFDLIRSNIDSYNYLWLLDLRNIRTPTLQSIRADWKGSKIVLAKTAVMRESLGKLPSNEYAPNLSLLSKRITGSSTLLFTNEQPQVVKDYFTAFVTKDFARANSISPISFTIPEGIIYSTAGQISVEEDVPISHSLEPTFRNKFNIPTRIKNGKVVLDSPFNVCQKGDKLSIVQSLILKQFGIACAEFKVKIDSYYDKKLESVILLTTSENDHQMA
ncbi:ribosome assembly factor MRT4 ASCRUDRAFT_77428 [Ascoidea rubescens DSM 1968]|uniref:Ribosome assembly factor mrt4 n=1 Tax=Ascoidea rubescens DSM 1968 TaxID=1344418 RepID=A0A1D2VBG8_9ASCO|nr:hypothetical protein ASCRUDRAFT_77428 [Ascoidea rubescens DSM 1968]ODV59018.1 hypothetical protein ASCRUDRAFT_77428 [Ascoidea rubescens DSM 1968]